MKEVFHQVAGHLATPEDCPSAFWRDLRLLAFDGTTFDVADTDANAAVFSRPAGSRGPGGYPQARVVALIECGTHAVLAAAIGDRGQGETTLALGLAGAAGPGSLVLADRAMLGVDLWNAFLTTGAQLLWRLKNTVATRPDAQLEDGSWLARVRIDKHAAAALRRAGKTVPSAITIRVVEYTLPGTDEIYRLGTSLLDPAIAPAVELAALYHQRWESEGVFAEIKTVQRGSNGVLLSARPDGVRQQIWAHLTVHRLTRSLIYFAATAAGTLLDPLRVSFRRAHRLIRRTLLDKPVARLIDRMMNRVVKRLVNRSNPARRRRSYPRAIKRRATPYPTKKTTAKGATRAASDFAPTIVRRPP